LTLGVWALCRIRCVGLPAGNAAIMEAKSRLSMALLMSSAMVLMVTFLVTVFDLGRQSGFFING
jgi:hypothetical protein